MVFWIFYHIKIAPESIKYTSFVTPLGQFEFLKMPFGLKIGPQRFQRFVLDEVVPSSLGNTIIYLDDILVATSTIDDQLDTLRRIFELLVLNNINLRIEKCFFLFTEIDFLGYQISKEGIQPTDSGVIAIRTFPEPKTVREVHSFLGLASYFRKFIEKFALIAQPLYSLLKKNAVFTFGEAERSAFLKLKDRLVKAPVLAIYNLFTIHLQSQSAHGIAL